MAKRASELFEARGFFDPRDSREGRWTSASEPKSIVLTKDYADSGAHQGYSVFIIKKVISSSFEGRMLEAIHLGSSDSYYSWYIKDKLKNDQPIWLHLCSLASAQMCHVRADAHTILKYKPEVIHVDLWRSVTNAEARLLKWVNTAGLPARKELPRPPLEKPPGDFGDGEPEEEAQEEDGDGEGPPLPPPAEPPPKLGNDPVRDLRDGSEDPDDGDGQPPRKVLLRGAPEARGGAHDDTLARDVAELEAAAAPRAGSEDLQRRLAEIKSKYVGKDAKRKADEAARGSSHGPAPKKQRLGEVLTRRVAERTEASSVPKRHAADNDEGLTIKRLKKALRPGPDESDESGEDVGGPGSGKLQQVDILRVWRRTPGRLAEQTLEKMARLLGTLAASDETEAAYKPIVQAYVHQVLFTNHPKNQIGIRNAREAETMALIADTLIRGEADAALDVVMQRLKALERSVSDGNWSVARWMELIPTGETQLSSREEARTALRNEEAERRHKAGPKAGSAKD